MASGVFFGLWFGFWFVLAPAFVFWAGRQRGTGPPEPPGSPPAVTATEPDRGHLPDHQARLRQAFRQECGLAA